MMKKYLTTVILTVAIMGVVAFIGCKDEVPGAVPGNLNPITNGSQDIGRSNRQWNDVYINGYLYTVNGTANVTLPDATGILAVTANETFTGTTTIADLVSTNATLTAPAVSGTTTIDDLVSDNATITGGTSTGVTYSGTTTIDDFVADNVTITGGSASGLTLTSPTISGTSVVSNRGSGTSGNLSSGSVVVTHSMSGTPTIIFLTYAAAPGYTTNTALYPSSINATSFTINTANTSVACKVYWHALIAAE